LETYILKWKYLENIHNILKGDNNMYKELIIDILGTIVFVLEMAFITFGLVVLFG
jgi:hypothetical protein